MEPHRPAASTYSKRPIPAFSLVELVGVLAILAILATVIVPKVFATLAASRIAHAASTVRSIKGAISEFAGKHGTIPLTTDTSRLDDLLVTDGLLPDRFTVRVGAPATRPMIEGAVWSRADGAWTATGGANQTLQTRLVSVPASGEAPVRAAGANFQLDGTTNLPPKARVVSAVIVNATPVEALELSRQIDGEAFSQTVPGTEDNVGKVVYAAPNRAGFTDVHIYIAHQ